MWAVDLQKNEMVVRDVILVAQGEMALEEFLKMVHEVWSHLTLSISMQACMCVYVLCESLQSAYEPPLLMKVQ